MSRAREDRGETGPTRRSKSSRSDRDDDVLVLEARLPVAERVLRRVAHVDDDEGAVPTVREELGVDTGGVEAGHRAGREARSADPDEEVCGLQESVELRHPLTAGLVRVEAVPGAHRVGGDARQLVVE